LFALLFALAALLFESFPSRLHAAVKAATLNNNANTMTIFKTFFINLSSFY